MRRLNFDNPDVTDGFVIVQSIGGNTHQTASLFCGGERGQIFHIDAAGKHLTQVASTDGFALGMALDGSTGVAASYTSRTACYEPSCVYKISPDGHVQLLIEDPEAHTLCHPTNCAFRGSDLFTANLGRWHITQVSLAVEGLPLPV